MAVILTRNPAYWADGFYVIPDQPGKPIVIDFQLRFKHLRKPERKELDQRLEVNARRYRERLQAISERKPDPGFTPEILDKEVLDLVLVDWSGFQDEGGSPAIYTPAARAQLVDDFPGIEAAFVAAYLQSRDPDQKREAAAKNSEAPSSTT